MDYQEADAKLQGRNYERRKIANNTYLERRGHAGIALRLHSTDILTFNADNSITLNSGGWRTVTTKARMNEYLGGKWGISQQNGQWFVTYHAEGKNDWREYWQEKALFEDGMILRPDGTFEGGEPIEKYKENLALRRKVQRFAGAYIRAMQAGKVPAPGPGDCFYCAMRDVNTGKPLGECAHSADHLLSHIEERYFVPSLLMRAIEVMPVSQVMKWAVGEKWYPEKMLEAGHGFDNPNHATFWSDYIRRDLQKSLSRYMLRQLGQAA